MLLQSAHCYSNIILAGFRCLLFGVCETQLWFKESYTIIFTTLFSILLPCSHSSPYSHPSKTPITLIYSLFPPRRPATDTCVFLCPLHCFTKRTVCIFAFKQNFLKCSKFSTKRVLNDLMEILFYLNAKGQIEMNYSIKCEGTETL